MVAAIVEAKLDEIVALCRKYRVRGLWLFGSAVTDAWDSDKSDIDFLVDLGGYESGVVYRYLDLADDLEALFNRRVDLISTGGLRRNSRLREEIERTRVPIYERDHAQTTA